MEYTLELIEKHGLTLEDIRRYALEQKDSVDEEGLIGFMHDGSFITNPWEDPAIGADITTREALLTYGKYNLLYFIEAASARITGNRLPSSSKPTKPRKLVVLRDNTERSYVLSYFTIATDLSAQEIEDEIEKAKYIASEKYPEEWQTSDVIDNLPPDWDIQDIECIETYI